LAVDSLHVRSGTMASNSATHATPLWIIFMV
jgi:hypothetical protein